MTITKSGELASFYTVNKTPIKHLRVYFSPKQAGEGNPSPENIRPIEGWNGVKQYYSGKNIGHIVGYSATSNNSPSGPRYLTNSYGTTLNTVNPETYLTIIQSQAPETKNVGHYTNGYFNIIVDNLIFDQSYDVSFRITNITNNPLNVPLQMIRLMSPGGGSFNPSEVKGDCLIFKNIKYTQYSSASNRQHFSIRICGMSFTISEFMVTTADIEDRTFESYQGFTTNYEFGVLGKNKLDKNSYKFLNSSIICFGGGASSEPDGSLILKAGTYTFSVSTTANMIFATDANKRNIISATNTNTATFTLPESIAIRIGCFIQNATDEEMLAYNYQLELGSVATEYEPYDSNHTVYGGYVDLITGEVCQEWHNVDSSQWIKYKESNEYYAYRLGGAPSAEKYSPTAGIQKISNMISEYGSFNSSNMNKNIIQYPNYVALQQDIDIMNLQYIYKLAEPVIYQLEPIELQTLLGHNNIWSNADRVEIEYDLAESNDILYRRRNVLEKQYPHIITPAANGLINFNTDMIAPLKGCKVYFNPIQEGEGDPSPENVRPISGWTGVRAYHVGQRLIPVDDIINPEANYNVTGNSILVYDSNEGGITMQGTTGATYFQHWYRVIGENAPTTTTSRLFIAKDNITVTLSFDYKHYGLDTVGNTWPIRIGGAETINIRANDAIPWTHFEKTYSLSEGQYISILIYRGVYWRNLQLITGTELMENEPYQGQSLTLDWSNSAGTIYGGYVDLTTGKVWKTWDIIDLGTCTWVQYNNNSSIFYTRNLKNLKESSDQYTVLCTTYPYEQQKYVTSTNDKTINDSQQLNMGNVAIRDTNYTNSTPAEFKEAMNGVICAYKLATPILVTTLTPLQLKTLRGINNIWSNSNGNIELSYWTH